MTALFNTQGALRIAATAVLLAAAACTTSVGVGVGYRSAGWYGHHGVSPWGCCYSPSFYQPEFSAAVLPPVHYGDFGDDFGGYYY